MPASLSSRPPVESIPVYIVSGFLGSGKSTLIRALLADKPPREHWAVLVNEFGRIGIDQTLFEARDDVTIKGLPGGCLCCQLAFVLQAGLVNLLHRARPDRLIIEPSGLGHPAGLLDVLRGDTFRDVLEIRDVIVLLDPRRLDDPRVREHETFRDQLQLADGVALTMTDLASEAQRQAAWHHIEDLWPPKRWLTEAPHGQLPVDRLLEGNISERGRNVPRSSAHQRLVDAPEIYLDTFEFNEPQPGAPQHERGSALGYATLGWRWHASELFDLDALTEVLAGLPGGIRVKGVWHTDIGWKLYNQGESGIALNDSAWRRDSRLELIGEHLPDAEALERRLMACRIAN
nr:CobW family GTP-binding protein [uncultured Halomonas sp.]